MSALWPWNRVLMGSDSMSTVTPSGTVQSTEILSTAGWRANLSDCITWQRGQERVVNKNPKPLVLILSTLFPQQILLWAACGQCLWWTERDQNLLWPFLWWEPYSHPHRSRRRNTWRHKNTNHLTWAKCCDISKWGGERRVRPPVTVSLTFHQIQHLFSVAHLSISEDEQLRENQAQKNISPIFRKSVQWLICLAVPVGGDLGNRADCRCVSEAGGSVCRPCLPSCSSLSLEPLPSYLRCTQHSDCNDTHHSLSQKHH